MKLFLARTAALSLSLLAACGGGDGSSHPAATHTAAGDVHLPTRDTSRDTLRDSVREPSQTPAAARDGTADTSRAAGKKAMPDSAIRIQLATQPKFRTKADSISLVAAIRTGLKDPGWPVKTPPLLPGSILPAKRIVAFYGNPLSKKMGILGEIPYDQMLAKLDTVAGTWRAADPTTPVQPALHLIV